MEENKDLKFDLQLFADESAGNMEQPIADSDNGSTEQNDDFEWSLDEEGNVVFDDSFFESSDSEPDDGGSAPPYEGNEQPETNEPPKYPVKINGVEQMVTLEELQRGYMQQSDLTK